MFLFYIYIEQSFLAERMMLRIQSAEGTQRVQVSNQSLTKELYEMALKVFNLEDHSFILYCKRDKSHEIISSKTKTIAQYGFNNGDMIYLFPITPLITVKPEDGAHGKIFSAQIGGVVGSKIPQRSNIVEDSVDVILQKLQGTIKRARDPKNCLHGENSSCIHCLPLEPYDSGYLKEQNIKHMSFHAYLRKLSSGLDRGKYANLDNISCLIKPGCSGHLPWPKGVCSKCQPKAISLNSQIYRHVDSIVVDNPTVVERFLHYWRVTGQQRIGFLYGKYDVNPDVPLGIKGVVAAIYEPPQESTRHSVRLLPNPHQPIVDQLAMKLGLVCIGWIFTDLLTEDPSKGTIRHSRNANSHFLSAQECIMAGHFQSLHPNPCSLSSDGHFGSKFVTICVTGDAQNQVHMEGYQVSNQCQALVRDECLVPTRDAPELAYVRQSTAEKYIPDVYYKEKDSYGNEVTRMARPLPVAYLLVDVPVSTPLEPIYTFSVNQQRPFPVENRPIDGQLQDVSTLAFYLAQFPPQRFLEAASDFHFLLYIATMDMLPLLESMDLLLEAVRSQNTELANEWASGDQWGTVTQLLAHADQVSIGSRGDEVGMAQSPVPGQSAWTCAHCTYINPANLSSCEICNLPHQA